MADVLRQIIAAKSGAIPSVCSAHPDVLRASLLLAQELDRPLVIEATSNQVNQDGGYMGMRPEQFRAYVQQIGADLGPIPIIFGGDHLGPQAWRHMTAPEAMAKAEVLVASYAAAGFTKLHLDCSEGCLGEPAQLPDAITAARSARLAQVALGAAPDPHALLFVIGTEVPPPGGARLDDHGAIAATTPDAARATLAAHGAAFDAAGIDRRLIGGLVVQPGVEFSPQQVHHLPLDRDPGLLAALDDWPHITLEAHSTDYQDPAVFPRLAELGFAFQKVGPALTFAWRTALYALDQGGALARVMESLMLERPAYWQGHYHQGDLRHQRHYALADRIRYYWPDPRAQQAVAALFADLDQRSFPTTDFTAAEIASAPHLAQSLARGLALARVQTALRPYFFFVQR